MKTMAAFLLALCLMAAPAWAAGGATLEGFDLGMGLDQGAKLAERNNLKLYYDEKEADGRVNRAYAGRILGMDNGDLSLLFKDGRLTMVTATLEADTPEGRRFIARKHKELDAEYRRLGGEQAEAVMPGLVDWVLPDRLLSVFKTDDDGKLVISITSRGNVE